MDKLSDAARSGTQQTSRLREMDCARGVSRAACCALYRLSHIRAVAPYPVFTTYAIGARTGLIVAVPLKEHVISKVLEFQWLMPALAMSALTAGMDILISP